MFQLLYNKNQCCSLMKTISLKNKNKELFILNSKLLLYEEHSKNMRNSPVTRVPARKNVF